ncbi:MAG: DUF115 domain-containing protein [Idiomarina sp.]|nr:DUF115 domain-containing protein [Idiomarina sp.]
MQFRDFRHQLEPDDARLSLWLESARERFFTNLALLQTQVPPLATQLRQHQDTEGSLCCDQQGHGNLLLGSTMQMAWPPLHLRRSYPSIAPGATLIAVELEDDGGRLLHCLRDAAAPFVLLYVPNLEHLYASFHCIDWTPLLRNTTVIFQLAGDLSQLEQDSQALREHGIPIEPCTVIHPQYEPSAEEEIWHFQQALTLNHDCDPVLRRHTHKFRQQPEFVLQNELIDRLREQPMTLSDIEHLLLCDTTPAVLDAVLALPQLKTLVFLSVDTQITEDTVRQFGRRGVQVVQLRNALEHLPAQLAQELNRLPVEIPWQLRLFQGADTSSARQLRQLVELELRYRVQPAMGLQRAVHAAVQAVLPEHVCLTRRTRWPEVQGKRLPALILGNGPSLTTTLAAIQAGHAEGYLIISCGTTLHTLAHHGVTPHFHLELELNASHVKKLPTKYLESVTLIAPVGFNRHQRALFGDSATFLLEGHPVDELLPGFPADVIRITQAFPTVLNLAIPLIAELGAQEIWLAGVDFGFPSIAQHHAEGGIYEQQDPARYVEHSGELIEVTGIDEQPLLTKREFQLAAFEAQQAIARYPNVRVYQLSRGLDVGGEVISALKPAHVHLPEKLLQPRSSCQLGWKQTPHNLDLWAPFAPWLNSLKPPAASALQTILATPLADLQSIRMKRAPVTLWAEGLQRNLAALMLRLDEQQRLDQAQFDTIKSALQVFLQQLDLAVAKI